MKESPIPRFLCSASLVTLGFVLGSPAAAQTTALSGEGIRFSDGSLQTTAATTTEAFPQQCEVAISADEEKYLSCGAAGLADPEWDDTWGVPADYYFLLTDVVVGPNQSADTDTGRMTFVVRHRSGCDNGVAGGGAAEQTTIIRLNADMTTWTGSFRSPLFLLPAGHCLSVKGGASNVKDAVVTVTGYLTQDPARFSP